MLFICDNLGTQPFWKKQRRVGNIGELQKQKTENSKND